MQRDTHIFVSSIHQGRVYGWMGGWWRLTFVLVAGFISLRGCWKESAITQRGDIIYLAPIASPQYK